MWCCPHCGYCSPNKVKIMNHMRHFAFPGSCWRFMNNEHPGQEFPRDMGLLGTMGNPTPKAFFAADSFLHICDVSIVHPDLPIWTEDGQSAVAERILTGNPTPIPLPSSAQVDWAHYCHCAELSYGYHHDEGLEESENETLPRFDHLIQLNYPADPRNNDQAPVCYVSRMLKSRWQARLARFQEAARKRDG